MDKYRRPTAVPHFRLHHAIEPAPCAPFPRSTANHRRFPLVDNYLAPSQILERRSRREFRSILASMSSGVSVDEFQALEQKGLRAGGIVKREREARAGGGA